MVRGYFADRTSLNTVGAYKVSLFAQTLGRFVSCGLFVDVIRTGFMGARAPNLAPNRS